MVHLTHVLFTTLSALGVVSASYSGDYYNGRRGHVDVARGLDKKPHPRAYGGFKKRHHQHHEPCNPPPSSSSSSSSASSTSSTSTSSSASETPSQPPTTVEVCRIVVKNTNTGADLGWVSTNFGPRGYPTITSTIASAESYVKGLEPGPWISIAPQTPTNPLYPYFGMEYYSDFHPMAEVGYTPPGSTRQPVGSAGSATATVEASIWQIQPNNNMIAQVILDNGAALSLALWYAPAASDQYLVFVNGNVPPSAPAGVGWTPISFTWTCTQEQAPSRRRR